MFNDGKGEGGAEGENNGFGSGEEQKPTPI
ncbi:hypothetical protein EVA_13213, partial [gut metagenome]